MIKRFIEIFLNPHEARMKRARKKLKRLLLLQSAGIRARLGDHGLMALLKADWYEGREWDEDKLAAFEKRFPVESSHPARGILREFGGLNIGGVRGMVIGHMEEAHTHSREIIDRLAGARLYPVGWTNIFEDDGLAVHVDEKGRVYVDGATGHDPPKDQRVDLIARDFDEFLRKVFAPGPTQEIQMWYYHVEGKEDAAE